jgi:hypothetical protein
MAGLCQGIGWIERAIWLENGQELAGRAQPLKKGKERERKGKIFSGRFHCNRKDFWRSVTSEDFLGSGWF